MSDEEEHSEWILLPTDSKISGQQRFDRNNNERVGERENEGHSQEEIGLFAFVVGGVLTSLSLGQYGKASVWDFPVTSSLSVIK